MKKTTIIFIFIAVICLFFFSDIFAQNQRRVISEGEHVFPDGIVVEVNEVLIIEPGSVLKMAANSRILVKGKILAIGTIQKPIIFQGDNTYWRGIKIVNVENTPDVDKYWNWILVENINAEKEFFTKVEEGNVFRYCQFKNTATKSRTFKRKNKWKAAIEAYNTSIHVSHSEFSDILFFGAVLTQRSYALINNNKFDSETMHKAINTTDNNVGLFYKNYIAGHRTIDQRCADGIWMKQDSVAIVSENTILNVGDDAIDLDRSKAVIYNNKIVYPMDDGIDIDNTSEAYLFNNNITRAVKDNAVLVSNWSKVFAIGNNITQSNIGFALRNGANVLACEENIMDNQVGILLYQAFPCVLTQEDFFQVKMDLSKANIKKIEQARIPQVKNNNDLVNFLSGCYQRGGDGKYFFLIEKKVKESLNDLEEVFKLTNLFKLDYDSTKRINKSEFCSSLTNKLYLTDSTVKGNKKDVLPYHEALMNFEKVEFSNLRDQKLSNSNFSCKADDKLMVTGILANAEKIIRRIQ